MKQQLMVAVCLVLLLLCASQVFGEAKGVSDGRVNPNVLVSSDWLAAQLHNPDNLVVIHISKDRKVYDAGHIPGAQFLALSQIVVSRGTVLNELAPVATLKAVFESIGVGDDTRVVIYGDAVGEMPSRVFFTLDYLGHDRNVALLDGGIEKWRAEGRELTTDVPTVQLTTFTPHLKPEVIVQLAQVRDASWEAANSPESKVVLWDDRPVNNYTGEVPAAGVARNGHIPGAVSLYWADLVASPTNPVLLPPRDLRNVLEAHGITPDKRVVVYCRTGMQATYGYFVLRYLGYENAVSYDGSMTEWGNLPDTEVVTGY
jgi:thiosulfate/3-mercaptopyruvate sulfurtransferase